MFKLSTFFVSVYLVDWHLYVKQFPCFKRSSSYIEYYILFSVLKRFHSGGENKLARGFSSELRV